MKRFPAAVLLFSVILAWTIGASSTSFMVMAEAPQGVISISFDDNYQSQYDYAFPLLQEYGIVGTFYIRTDNIGKPGYMSVQQLLNLQSSGNEIGSHSHTHTPFTSLSADQIRYECNSSKQILQNYGLTATNFAYPDGLTNGTIDLIVSEYYRSGRTAYIEPYLMEAPTSQFRLAGFSAETADPSALSLLKGMVDQVHSTNSWTVIFFHNIIPNAYAEPYTTSAEDFENFLNYTVSKGVQTLSVNQVLDLTPLSIMANFGTVSPTSGLYSRGESYNIQAFSPSAREGERYVWLGWSGSGAGSYSGTNNPASITLNGPITETASWRREFRLLISTENGDTSPSPGEYWYDVGTVVNIEAVSPVAGYGERYIFKSWRGTGLGSYSGSNPSASLVLNDPITQTSSWVHQYFVNVSSVFGVIGGGGWYNSGATAYATLDQSTINESSSVRQFFEGWTGDALGTGLTSDSVAVNSPKSVVASWKKQYLVIFDQTGLPAGSSANVLVDSFNHSLPYSVWVDESSKVDFVYPNQVSISPGSSYRLAVPLAQSPIEVNSPTNLTAQYTLKHTLDSSQILSLAAITATVALVVSVLLLRRRKSRS